MIDGDDLAERLHRLEASLDLSAKVARSEGVNRPWQAHEAGGVRLALCYVEEALRTLEATDAPR